MSVCLSVWSGLGLGLGLGLGPGPGPGPVPVLVLSLSCPVLSCPVCLSVCLSVEASACLSSSTCCTCDCCQIQYISNFPEIPVTFTKEDSHSRENHTHIYIYVYIYMQYVHYFVFSHGAKDQMLEISLWPCLALRQVVDQWVEEKLLQQVVRSLRFWRPTKSLLQQGTSPVIDKKIRRSKAAKGSILRRGKELTHHLDVLVIESLNHLQRKLMEIVPCLSQPKNSMVFYYNPFITG